MRKFLDRLPQRERLTGLVTFARAEIVAVSAMFVLAVAGFSFQEIADDVSEGDTHGIDLAILDALRAGGPEHPVGPGWLKLAAADLTALGSITVLGLIVLLVAGLFLAIRRPAGSLILIAASGSGIAISQGLKALFGRERPPILYHAVEAANPSFPSGHAMLSAVVFLTLGALAARLSKRRRVKGYIMAAAVMATLLVGMTRIYLGVHWASDVLAGWCVGAAWATACWLMVWAWQKWVSPRWRAPEAETD